MARIYPRVSIPLLVALLVALATVALGSGGVGGGLQIAGEAATGDLAYWNGTQWTRLAIGSSSTVVVGGTTPSYTGTVVLSTVSAGAFNLGDGGATSPSAAFTSDANTGLYWVGADQIGFTTGGVNRATLANGGLTLATALSPANGGTGATGTPANGQLPIGNGTNYTLATLAAGENVSVTNASGSITVASTLARSLQGFRLTLTSGTPVTTADVTGASTLYLSPFASNQIAVPLDGNSTPTSWGVVTSAEISIVFSGVALQADKNYDVFAWGNGSTLALEIGSAWTTDTGRAVGITRTAGVWLHSTNTRLRYVGTIRATGSTTTEDSAAKRFVFNADNRRARAMSVIEATDSWTYTTDGWRQANGSTANQLDYVVGLNEDAVSASVHAMIGGNNGAAAFGGVGIGVDSAIANSAQIYGGMRNSAASVIYTNSAQYVGFPGVGRHYLVWLENANIGTGTTTWYGDDGVPTDQTQSGIVGEVWQ